MTTQHTTSIEAGQLNAKGAEKVDEDDDEFTDERKRAAKEAFMRKFGKLKSAIPEF